MKAVKPHYLPEWPGVKFSRRTCPHCRKHWLWNHDGQGRHVGYYHRCGESFAAVDLKWKPLKAA